MFDFTADKNYQDLKLAQAVAREKLNAENSAEIE